MLSIAVYTLVYFLTLSISMASHSNNDEKPHAIHIQVSKGLTSIVTTQETTFLDYKQGVATYFHTSSGACRKLSLFYDKDISEEQKARFAVFEEVTRLPNDNYNHTPVHLMIAPKALTLKTVRESRLLWRGVTFHPGIIKLTLYQDNELLSKLQQAADVNKSYADIHLIHPFDVISLMPYLDGVPREGIWRSMPFTCSFTLLSYEEHRRKMEDLCKD